MSPGADSEEEGHTDFFAGVGEEADVAVAGEIEFAFGVFVVVPEDVGGGDVDSAFFHFSEFAFPVFLRDAGEVDFAHFHDAGFAVAEDGVVGDGSSCGRRLHRSCVSA